VVSTVLQDDDIQGRRSHRRESLEVFFPGPWSASAFVRNFLIRGGATVAPSAGRGIIAGDDDRVRRVRVL
jgi:hypothetical protein